MSFNEIIQIVPQAIIGILIIYWVAAQIIPSLRPKGKNNNPGISKEDLNKLFDRYDSLIKIVQDNYAKEIEGHNKIINHLMDISKTTAFTIESLGTVISAISKQIENVYDEIGKIRDRSISIDGKLDSLLLRKSKK